MRFTSIPCDLLFCLPYGLCSLTFSLLCVVYAVATTNKIKYFTITLTYLNKFAVYLKCNSVDYIVSSIVCIQNNEVLLEVNFTLNTCIGCALRYCRTQSFNVFQKFYTITLTYFSKLAAHLKYNFLNYNMMTIICNQVGTVSFKVISTLNTYINCVLICYKTLITYFLLYFYRLYLQLLTFEKLFVPLYQFVFMCHSAVTLLILIVLNSKLCLLNFICIIFVYNG